MKLLRYFIILLFFDLVIYSQQMVYITIDVYFQGNLHEGTVQIFDYYTGGEIFEGYTRNGHFTCELTWEDEKQPPCINANAYSEDYGGLFGYVLNVCCEDPSYCYINTTITLHELDFKTKDQRSNINSLIPYRNILCQNYPNPFNPETNIQFMISQSGIVNVSVYDLNGKLIETLINDYLFAGSHEIRFNAMNLASGVYFYKIEAGTFSDRKKMIVLK